MDMDEFKIDQWSDEELYEEICNEVSENVQIRAAETERQSPEIYTAVRIDIADKSIPQTHPVTEEKSDSDSEDNIPLAKLVQQSHVTKRLPVRRKLIPAERDSYEDNVSDDSTKDSTYKQSTSEISDDDLTSPNFKRRKVRRKRTNGTKQNECKKKQKRSNVKRTLKKTSAGQGKQTKTVLQKLQERIKLLKAKRTKQSVSKKLADMSKAKQISRKMHDVQMMIAKCHKTRVDNLLASNDLKRVPVTSDGNCFFSAVCQTQSLAECEQLCADDMRSEICQYLLQEKDKYAEFFTNMDDFEKEVDSLRSSGRWNSVAADCLPLAVADKYNVAIRIFSSEMNTPVYDIRPTDAAIAPTQMINIAHIAVRNAEHYDATISTTKMNTNIQVSSPNTQSNGPAASIGNEDIATPEKQHDRTTDACTPHKRADYKSPQKKVRSRKKMRNEMKWKRNVRKNARCGGKEYISVKGTPILNKKVRPQDCSRCRFKCNEKFSEDDRNQIFNCYYGLGSYEMQRQFICDMIIKQDIGRKGKGKKTKALQYFLQSGTNKRERICRTFFKKTLDVSNKLISYTMERKRHGVFDGKDMRGRTPSANKISDDHAMFINAHINSFPKMESHYSRKTSKRQYLSHDLNIKNMWELYKDECSKQNIQPVSEAKYRKVFCEQHNLSFFKPKKDQCSLCARYDRHKIDNSISDELQEEYNHHQIRKTQAREEKENDKSKAKQDNSLYVATFDMQAVLTTPCSLVSELYYSRKLCCYNLTIYSLANGQAVCHLWDETQGKRGSCEIATCLLKNTESVCSSNSLIKEITYYSDTCGGQNRNQFVAASYVYAINKLPQLQILNHKFLQSGHSQMECDSVHGAIEVAKKNTSIFVPSQWSTIVCLARKSKPYIAVPLKYDHVIDFKSFVKNCSLNFRSTPTGIKINWLNIRWIQARHDHPKSLFVNYTFDPNSFIEIEIQSKGLRRRGPQVRWPEKDSDIGFCFESKQPISVKKKQDLVGLCEWGIIPEDFHQYYERLPISKSVSDRNPGPSIDDETDDEEYT